ncbi:ATP-binding cassette domain-containing protein [Streptomyces sp. NPDC002185]|uniref:ABC transporter ATP-binding protein n=1 Tax=unclassified Streptomyces TaxID=2593676 RepID=UPI0036798D41
MSGHDVARDPVAVRRRIGYVFGGDRGLYDRLSALDNLRHFAEPYGVPARGQRRRIAELLGRVGLVGRERGRVEGYSRGMRQRLHIARVPLHHPDVLFLDEPSLGVDPVAARDLRRAVADLAAAGTTVLLTTHHMAEADELCDRIAVIAGGRIRALGTPGSLKSRVGDRDVLDIEAYGADEEVLDRVRRVPGVRGVAAEDRGAVQTLSVQTDRGAELHAPVLAALDGVRIGRVVSREPSLEDAYIAIVEETAAEGPTGSAEPDGAGESTGSAMPDGAGGPTGSAMPDRPGEPMASSEPYAAGGPRGSAAPDAAGKPTAASAAPDGVSA